MTADLDIDLASIAATLRASTVRVHDVRGRGYGAGIVWDADGTILSNAHVVRGAGATVEWNDGRTQRAEVVRRDDRRDLAALRVAETDGLIAAAVRPSNTVVLGELAIAAGNPHGLQGMVTAGLVQRCNSQWVVADVRLAPGNSGGPLADAWGRVIGINAMVARGLALAIPSDAAIAFAQGGKRSRRLGVALARAVARIDGRPAFALIVTAVEAGSVAERAGLQLGDAILAPSVEAIRTSDALDVVRAGVVSRVPIAWEAPGATRAA